MIEEKENQFFLSFRFLFLMPDNDTSKLKMMTTTNIRKNDVISSFYYHDFPFADKGSKKKNEERRKEKEGKERHV